MLVTLRRSPDLRADDTLLELLVPAGRVRELPIHSVLPVHLGQTR
jgi:hypothetical protein